MIATVLTDNTANGDLCGEWGLSIHIEYEGRRYLLDTGETDLFLRNARKLHIAIEDVEYGILSHAHYDHGDGMDAFFEANRQAKFYVRGEARRKCYDRGKETPKYIGIKDGVLENHPDRIVFLDKDQELNPGVHIIGHHTAGLEAQGLRASMFVRDGDGWIPDAFAHEQSLVFETDAGLVLFSSCSHAGADTILREVAALFPGREICAMIGGLHLFIRTPREVRALAQGMRETGVRRVITGHCTGDAAIAVLREELGPAVETLYCGKRMEF